MYHLELNKFPNKMARFNLSEREMLAVLLPWVHGEWVEFGERQWNSHEARITILEGPQIPVQRLRVGHGWRLAQRQAEDVTERLLARAREMSPAAPKPPRTSPDGEELTGVQRDVTLAPATEAAAAPPDGAIEGPSGGQEAPVQSDQTDSLARAREGDLLADSLGLQLLPLLDNGPTPLATVWELAQERLPGRPVSESLALAERAVRSLLRSRLIVLDRAAGEKGDRSGTGGGEMGEGEVVQLLESPGSWSGDSDGPKVLIGRAP